MSSALSAPQVFERVPVQPRDAREASDVFYKQGQGDALLNYENEVIFTNASYPPGDALPYVAPQHNVRVRLRRVGIRVRSGCGHNYTSGAAAMAWQGRTLRALTLTAAAELF